MILMTLTIIAAIALLALIIVLFFTNIGGDYTKKTDQQLLALWPLHENNLRAAKAAGPVAYKKAIEKSSSLTNEMKRRGLLNSDFVFESDALDSVARKLFSRSLEELKSLAKAKDALALYQLGMIFHSIKEPNTSIQYMSESAALGNANAQYALGWAYMTEGSGVIQNAAEALKWFKISAQQGHAEAQKALTVAIDTFPKANVEAGLSEAEKWSAANARRE